MNDRNEVVQAHLDTTQDLITKADQVRRDRNKTNRLISVAAVAASIAVVVSTVLSFVIYQQKVSERQNNGRRIDDLTVELREARDVLDSNDAQVKEELDCQHKFDVLIQNMAINYLGSLGDLVIEATRDPQNISGITAVVDTINLRLSDYRTALDSLEAWRETFPPGTCPI